MDLHIVEGAIGLDPLVGVTRVTVHVAVRVRSAAVTEKVHQLVNSLLVSGQIVPEHGGILQVSLRIPLLGVNEDGELGRIPQEENRSIVEHPIPVSFIGIELDGEPTRIASTVDRTLFTSHGGETGKQLGLFPDSLEHVDDSLYTYRVSLSTVSYS